MQAPRIREETAMAPLQPRIPTTLDAPQLLFPYALRLVTEAAARACYDWIGRGDKVEADRAAVHAMRETLNRLPFRGVVVIGEGEKDEAPELYKGEVLGALDGEPTHDIAVDPLEGTSYLVKGLTNAMAAIALAPRGAMFDPGPCYYMEKFAAPPAARGEIEPDWPVEKKLRRLAEVLGRRVSDLTVYVLEKPRHERLVKEIHAAGARVALYPAGDVAGAIMAALPDSGIDALMGTGGTPEGILAACAIRALGGTFFGRMDPQLAGEKARVREAGIDTERWWRLEELVRSPHIVFCATGITTGLLFEGVERTSGHYRTQTLIVSGHTGERQLLTTWLPRRPDQGE